MKGILSKIFHKHVDFDYPIGHTPSDPQSWPMEWREIKRKEYERFPKTILTHDFLALGNLQEALLKRKSLREYNVGKKIALNELSTLLYYSAGVKPMKDNRDSVRRFYPSGGARYPLELYLGIFRVENMSSGLYHYNVKEHSLEELSTDSEDISDLKEGLYYPWSRDAAIVIYITAVWERNMIKYDDRGYRIVLMEAGHVAQNIALVASSLGIGCCNSVGFHNKHTDNILDIVNHDEDSLYMALLGK
jgi:SagB-type dehydrogenase family enzyme